MSTNGDLIAALRDAAAGLVALPPPDVGAIDEVDALLEINGLIQLAIEERVRKVDRSGEAKSVGYASTASWLRANGRMNRYTAGTLRRNAREFDRLHATVTALRNGDISHGMASAIAAAVHVLPDDQPITDTEKALLDLAVSDEGTVEKVASVGKYLRTVLDPDGTLSQEEKAHRKRYLTAHTDDHGGMSGSFYLPPEAAARLQALLDKYAGPRTAGDTRNQTQRNADALIQLLSNTVEAELLVLVNAEALTAPASTNHTHHNSHGTNCTTTGGPLTSDPPANGSNTPARLMPTGHPLPAAHTRRLATTSRLYRMVVSAKGKPLDLGAGVRLVPGWMRRAVLATYDTCSYDDCAVEAKHCQMDHAYEWSTHHRTKLDEIVPACAYHNRDRATHPHKYQLTQREDGRWHFTTTSATAAGLRLAA